MSLIGARRTHWPRWTRVIEYWRTLDVPDVEVRAWSPARRHVARWDKKAEFDLPNHWYCTSSPQDQTAYHIARDLPLLNEDLRAAYILEAHCRGCELNEFVHFVVRPVNQQYGCAPYGWWHANAKHVLPGTESGWLRVPRGEAEGARQWREIVFRSAEEWRAVANEWVVVRTPDLMDVHSQEYAEYVDWARRRDEQNELREYERLRKKFEHPSSSTSG